MQRASPPQVAIRYVSREMSLKARPMAQATPSKHCFSDKDFAPSLDARRQRRLRYDTYRDNCRQKRVTRPKQPHASHCSSAKNFATSLDTTRTASAGRDMIRIVRTVAKSASHGPSNPKQVVVARETSRERKKCRDATASHRENAARPDSHRRWERRHSGPRNVAIR